MSRAGASDAAARAAARGRRLAAGRQVRGDPRPARPLRQLADERRAPADGRRGQARRRARPVPGRGDREHPGQQDLHARPAGRRLGRRGRTCGSRASRTSRGSSSSRPGRASTRRSTGEATSSPTTAAASTSGATTTATATSSSTTSARTGTAPSGVVARTTPPIDYKWSVAGGRQARARQRRHDRRLRELLLRARQLVLRRRHRRLVLGRRTPARR